MVVPVPLVFCVEVLVEVEVEGFEVVIELVAVSVEPARNLETDNPTIVPIRAIKRTDKAIAVLERTPFRHRFG